MAHDLIFGKTSRDWSLGRSSLCGILLDPTITSQLAEQGLKPAFETRALAKKVRADIDKNVREMTRLTNEKRLPEVERKAFGVFFRKWLAFNEEKNQKFTSDDFVALTNFSEANKRFTERLAVFTQMAKTPLKTPVGPVESVALVPTVEGGKPWGFWMGLGLGVLGLGFLARIKRT